MDRYARTFFVIGTVCVIVGGVVAAATGPLQWEKGSWAAAFLVLVSGVAQCALGVTQGALAPAPLTRAIFWVELLCWNIGCFAVIGGTLATQPLIVDVGGILLVVALALMIRAVYRSRTRQRWLLWTFRVIVAIMFISIPIGLTLAAIRAG
jgi:hypothetical protein